MTKTQKIPFYAKTALISISLFAFVYTIDTAQDIIIPIIYAVLLAILLNPIVNFLSRKGINRLAAILLTVVFSFFVVAAIFYVVVDQASHLSNSFPQMKAKFMMSSADFVNWISGKTHIHTTKINIWLKETQSEQLNNLAVKENISLFGHIVMTTVLLPVYLVMVLYYKPLLLDFIRRLFRLQDHIAVEEVLSNTKKITKVT